jgi:two-component system, cell cycle response regulator DivK
MIFKLSNQLQNSDKIQMENSTNVNIMKENNSDNNQKEKAGIQNLSQNPDWSDYTVLVAEDEETNFVYLQTALMKTKINVIRAKNGREAVELARINPYINIILMDIKMPEMNGLEATRSIKSFRKDIPIIAQTAFAMEEDMRNCEAIGCDGFLSKPIRYKVLIEALNKYLK